MNKHLKKVLQRLMLNPRLAVFILSLRRLYFSHQERVTRERYLKLRKEAVKVIQRRVDMGFAESVPEVQEEARRVSHYSRYYRNTDQSRY